MRRHDLLRIALFGRSKEALLRRFSCWNTGYRHDTFSRVFRILYLRSFEEVFGASPRRCDGGENQGRGSSDGKAPGELTNAAKVTCRQ